MADKNEVFVYSYSAEEQDIVRKIRQKYMPEEENKMEQLIKLDKSTRTMGRVAAITLGIVSTIVFGTGMCCVLEWDMFILGVIIGMIGIGGMVSAYPIYSYINKKHMEKIAPKIMELTEELLKQN